MYFPFLTTLFALGETQYAAIAIGIAIAWIIGFFMTKFILKRTLRPASINAFSIIIGLLLSPVILSLLLWMIMAWTG